MKRDVEEYEVLGTHGLWIGDFVFRVDSSLNLYMANDDGEMMQLNVEAEEKLNELLKVFFKEQM